MPQNMHVCLIKKGLDAANEVALSYGKFSSVF